MLPDDDYDPWEDYDDDYEEEISPIAYSEPRINFVKYGKNSTHDEDKWTRQLPKGIYCDLVNTLNEKCVARNLLEIFRYDEELIKTATKEEILLAVNNLKSSPWFGYETDFSALLGGIIRNETGHIVSATSALMVWSISVPEDAEVFFLDGGTALLEADKTSYEWEKLLIETTLNLTSNMSQIYPQSDRSLSDLSNVAIWNDLGLLAAGYVLMFLYTVFTLSSFNQVDFKLYLSISGIIAIVLGMSMGLSLSFAIGYPWEPFHKVIPLLCLGIGIDDMFVIVQSVNIIKNNKDLENLGVGRKISLALKHSGVAVLVTSVTDVFIFIVGAVTVRNIFILSKPQPNLNLTGWVLHENDFTPPPTTTHTNSMSAISQLLLA